MILISLAYVYILARHRNIRNVAQQGEERMQDRIRACIAHADAGGTGRAALAAMRALRAASRSPPLTLAGRTAPLWP